MKKNHKQEKDFMNTMVRDNAFNQSVWGMRTGASHVLRHLCCGHLSLIVILTMVMLRE
jgi:hypothetical protein